LFFTGSLPFFAGLVHVGYHSRQVFLESPQLSDVPGQNRVSAEVLYYLRRCISLLFELTLVPVILYPERGQCLIMLVGDLCPSSQY